jgi:hypothetical protein
MPRRTSDASRQSPSFSASEGVKDFGSHNTNQPFIRAGIWLQDFWPEALTLFGNIGLASGAAWLGTRQSNKHWYVSAPALIIWLSLIMVTLGTVAVIRSRQRISELQYEISRLRTDLDGTQQDFVELVQDLYVVFETQLGILSDKLRFGNTERISVYTQDSDAFIMLGRYSKNPEYQKPGRAIYPNDEGCIARAWRNGECFIADLPDPTQVIDDYLGCLEEDWNIPRDTGQAFKMKSRSLSAFAIEGSDRHRIAVVVFESTRTDVLKFDRIRQAMRQTEGVRLSDLIEKLRPLKPSPEYASKEGF